MIEEIKKESNSIMEKSLDSLKSNLSKIRTGRAHPSILETIKVDYRQKIIESNKDSNFIFHSSCNNSIW